MRLGIDTGGTYTDAVLFDEGRVVASAKALTTKHELAIGIRGAVDQILGDSGGSSIELVSISTTLATNAIVEGHGDSICLLLVGQKPGALTRSRLEQALFGDPVAFIDGGHTASGDEQMALDRPAVLAAIDRYQNQVAAFAVAGHFAVRNADHEARVRDLVRQQTGLPVTCSHELSSRLDAPRRALTAVLNARLIPLIQSLVLAVQNTLAQHAIKAPLMVVKGDGSLISANVALERPVETILSGPAASLIGAHHLSARDNVMVADMGGTTTDIAIMQDGRPRLNHDGAVVGGWRTMVEAADIYTVGLGGDSEVRCDERGRLVVGPQRALPLSLLAVEHPSVLHTLHRQNHSRVKAEQGRFVLRQRVLSDEDGVFFSAPERRVWASLADGPVALTTLVDDPRMERPLKRLRARGLVQIASLTPSDAAHVLGDYAVWDTEAAALGAGLWRRAHPQIDTNLDDDMALCAAIRECVIRQSAQALIAAALANEGVLPLGAPSSLDSVLLRRGVTVQHDAVVNVEFALGIPLVAVGAPAQAYYHRVAERVNATCGVPPHADVCNAVGAVASGIVQHVSGVITAPSEDRFRVHLPSGIRDFEALEDAAGYAAAEARRLAQERAASAGSARTIVVTDRHDTFVNGFGGHRVFIESKITATASGRPRRA